MRKLFVLGFMIAMLPLITSCGKKTTTKYIVGVQGERGTNGKDGTDAINRSMNLIEVCPQFKPSRFMEVIVELDGQFMAFLADNKWKENRLVKLEEGIEYETTDGRGARFKIEDKQINCLN